ncbi:MAG: hypothetical protein HN867_17370 [Deltaproteobacteria bacterium]|nr:hypothetical protein [Deltaproteobacteria bacterium]MDG2196120.1 hypothetical protein [SAR324 cluster bacterium]
MKVFRSVSLCIGLGLLSWANSLSAHEASKINAESLLRKYFRSEMLSYTSRVENRCRRIGLNVGNVDQILVEEIKKAELQPLAEKIEVSLPRILLVSEVSCLSQYLGNTVFYRTSVSFQWEDGKGASGRLTLGPPVSAMGLGDEVRKPLNSIRKAVREKIRDLLNAQRRQAE